MIVVSNGKQELTLTKGAYLNQKNMLDKQNYKIIKGKIEPKVTTNKNGRSPIGANTSPVKDDSKNDSIENKNITEWTKDELKKYADANDISLKDVKNIDEARAKIAEFIKNK